MEFLFLILFWFSQGAVAEEKVDLCTNAHMKALNEMQLPLESAFEKKKTLEEPFREARSACARFNFDKEKEKLAEQAFENWNQQAAELCEPFFDAQGKEDLFAKATEKSCGAAVFRAVIANVRSSVGGLKSICELVQDTQEMDLDSGCEALRSKRSDGLRF